jgi:hypothetical protein
LTSLEFKAWREQLELSQEVAAKLLLVSKRSVTIYEQVVRRDDNRSLKIPTAVELRCKNLAFQRRLYQELKMREIGNINEREEHREVIVDKAWDRDRLQELRDRLFEIDVLLSIR